MASFKDLKWSNEYTNYSGGLFTVNPNDVWKGDNGATDLLGKVTRAQWNHYKNLYLPAIEREMATIGSADALNEQIARSERGVEAGFSNLEQSYSDKLRAYGTQLDTDQQESFSRQIAFSKDKALGDARNITRTSKYDRDMALIAGSTGNLASLSKGE